MTRASFDIATTPGLRETEAAQRLAADGPNEIASARPRNLLQIAFSVIREPMLLLLVAAGSINLLVSMQEPGRIQDAVLLFSFVLVVIGISLYQERKTERALAALRDLASPRALVVRDGVQRRIPGRDVVLGDVVLIAEGDRVPADAIVLYSDEIRNNRAEEFQAFITDPVNCRPQGAEPLDTFLQRVNLAYEDIIELNQNHHYLIVAHAGVIRAIIARTANLVPSGFYRIKISNGGVTRIRHTTTGPILELLNGKLAGNHSND